jgi:hypothetical protein
MNQADFIEIAYPAATLDIPPIIKPRHKLTFKTFSFPF